MNTDKTKIEQGEALGGLQNHFNHEPREPRKMVLSQRRNSKAIHRAYAKKAEIIVR